jgi:hypothetical protein
MARVIQQRESGVSFVEATVGSLVVGLLLLVLVELTISLYTGLVLNYALIQTKRFASINASTPGVSWVRSVEQQYESILNRFSIDIGETFTIGSGLASLSVCQGAPRSGWSCVESTGYRPNPGTAGDPYGIFTIELNHTPNNKWISFILNPRISGQAQPTGV